MKNIVIVFILIFLVAFTVKGQETTKLHPLLPVSDFEFLKQLTSDVLDSSQVLPVEKIPGRTGFNNTGGPLIVPGGRGCYPAFWIRDYAMSLECGFIPASSQKHMLLLAASTQNGQTWITQGGSMVPLGAIADHIRPEDSLPVYFPGTYDVDKQGIPEYGWFPPYCDQFYFIHMAYVYVKTTSDLKILSGEINEMPLSARLEMAFEVPPVRRGSDIVYTTDNFRGVDFGFRDVIQITGDLCFPTILKFRAANEMAELFEKTGNSEKAAWYRTISENIKSSFVALFQDESGMLLASTGKSKQPDVWSTALAAYFHLLEGQSLKKACHCLSQAYKQGVLSYHGNIRHILTTDDFSAETAWEVSLAKKNTYQNGAYWGTPAGWVCYAISLDDYNAAKKLADEYVNDLRENDFRKGGEYGAPYECFHPSGHKQNPVYLATVACPYIVFKTLNE